MLGYRIDLYFYNYKLAIEIGKMDIVTEILTAKQKYKNSEKKNLVIS